MNIDCPKCKKNIDLERFDMLPEKACDSEEVECCYCEHAFYIGWYATAELR